MNKYLKRLTSSEILKGISFGGFMSKNLLAVSSGTDKKFTEISLVKRVSLFFRTI